MKAVSLECALKLPSSLRGFCHSAPGLLGILGLAFVTWGPEILFRKMLGPFGLHAASVRPVAQGQAVPV